MELVFSSCSLWPSCGKFQDVQGSNLQAAKAQDSVRQVGGQDSLGTGNWTPKQSPTLA